MIATLFGEMKRLGIVLVVALAACSPPPVLPDRAEPDAQVIDDAAPDAQLEADASAADASDASASDARADVGGDGCVDYFTVYTDNDGDGIGAGGALLVNCGMPMPARSSLRGDDCNDMNPRIFPGAAERCDGVDSNCDENFDRSPPGEPRMLPRDETHVSCADSGQRLFLWNIGEWGYQPRCAYRGLESFPPFRNVGSTVCQACRARNGGECVCWTDPPEGGGMSVPCPFE